MSNELWIKNPLVYIDISTRRIIYFTFDAPVVEKIIDSMEPKPTYSLCNTEKETYWKQAQFDTLENFNAAALALRLTFK